MTPSSSDRDEQGRYSSPASHRQVKVDRWLARLTTDSQPGSSPLPSDDAALRAVRTDREMRAMIRLARELGEDDVAVALLAQLSQRAATTTVASAGITSSAGPRQIPAAPRKLARGVVGLPVTSDWLRGVVRPPW